MSIPVTIDLPSGYRRVEWPGRLGNVAAVVGDPVRPRGRVLLIPGLTGSKEDYFALLGPLHDDGWAVAAADLPGMYESAGSPDPADHRLPLAAADVAAMLRVWSPERPAHLVGHSAGGLIARHTAAARPDSIASLTLYASGCGPVLDEARDSAVLLQQVVRTMPTLDALRLKVAMDTAAGRPLPEPAIGAFLERRWQATTAGHLIAMAELTIAGDDLVQRLGQLSAAGALHVLVLSGQLDDGVWPGAAFDELARSAATASARIEGAAHSAAVENPVAMAAALTAFWRGLP